jgi:hypothetical protein
MADNTSRTLRLVAALALTALAANCFLKYLWWTACYSAWYGIPKLAEQWKAAGANASFNGWSLIALDAASVAIFFSLITLRSTSLSGFFKNGVRLAASLATTIAGTALLALALSWFKQGIH